MGQLLLRGMLAGLLAAFLAFGFAKIIGEPQVERAIGFEEQQAAAEKAPGAVEEPQLVSRDVQSGIGLLTGLAVFGAALGGLFAIAFAVVDQRLLRLRPRTTALLIGIIGFVALYMIPYLKYPANPPAVGAEDTIGYRTQLYFAMMVFSAAALAIAIAFGRALSGSLGVAGASLGATLAYFALVALVAFALPAINEIPAEFPSDLLWKFRGASLGLQAVLWLTLALAFGTLVERAEASRSR